MDCPRCRATDEMLAVRDAHHETVVRGLRAELQRALDRTVVLQETAHAAVIRRLRAEGELARLREHMARTTRIQYTRQEL
jgi:hypothetical protein